MQSYGKGLNSLYHDKFIRQVLIFSQTPSLQCSTLSSCIITIFIVIGIIVITILEEKKTLRSLVNRPRRESIEKMRIFQGDSMDHRDSHVL